MRVAVICICFSLACNAESNYIGIPEKTWANASRLCPLSTVENIGKNLTGNKWLTKRNITKVWTGTRLKYSHWTAFIGCVDDTTITSPGSSASLKNCSLHCSADHINTHFALKNRNCVCLSTKPNLLKQQVQCRKQCTDSKNSLCSSGIGYMVFQLLRDINVQDTTRLIENQCIATQRKNEQISTDKIANCNETYEFSCVNNAVYSKQTWDAYQEQCFKDNVTVFFQGNMKVPSGGTFYWKPIFRTHSLISGDDHVSNEKCVALDMHNNTEPYSVENCTELYPFVCRKSGRTYSDKKQHSVFPRFITVPITAVIASGLFIIILLIIIISLATRLRKMKKKKIDSQLSVTENNEHELTYAPPPKRVVALRDTYIEAGDAPIKAAGGAYHDVYDDVNKQFYVK